MKDVKREVVRQSRGSIILQEGLAESLRFPLGDHAAAPGGDGHGAGAAQDLQLHRSALDASDSQSNATIVNLVVGIFLEGEAIKGLEKPFNEMVFKIPANGF